MAIYLKNGMVFDGIGSAPRAGGILINEGKIRELCDTAPDMEGLEIIDCEGMWIMPGLIDAHSHNDFFVLNAQSEDYFRPFIEQGITTFVVGNCGFSVSGYETDSPHISKIGGSIFSLDEGSASVGDFNVWRKEADKCALANIAPLVGHGTARISVNGKGAEPLTGDKRERMLAQLEQALRDGALGISLGLMYEPGIFAPHEELLEVARLVKRYDRILTVHPKAESNVSLSYPLLGRSHLLRALEELADIVRQTSVRLQYSHLIFVGRRTWPDEAAALKIFEDLQSEGYEAMFDMYPLNYGASVITVVLPEWYMKLSIQKRLSKWTRLKLWAMITVTSKLLGFGFSDITIAYAGEERREWIGKTIPKLAKTWGISPFGAYLRACEESHFEAAVLQGGYQNLSLMRRLMRHPLSLYMTDAWVAKEGKQNGGIYGAFPMFLEQARETGFPMEQAIAKMTGLTARRFRLKDRGEIRSGAIADITVIDPSALKSRIDEELPPLGVRHVFIGGQAVLRDGMYLGVRGAGSVVTASE